MQPRQNVLVDGRHSPELNRALREGREIRKVIERNDRNSKLE